MGPLALPAVAVVTWLSSKSGLEPKFADGLNDFEMF
jgi:hypothetical protein